jgi:hypothetical protein
MKRQINKGDVIGWECSTRTLTINGQVVKEEKGMDFEEAVAILERQIAKYPEAPWSKELTPVNFTTSQLTCNTGTQVILPILGCLKAAEEFLAKHEGWAKLRREVVWTPMNEEQYQFLKRFLEAKSVVDALGDNLKRKADRDVNVINSWLKEHGFDIQLRSEQGRAFAVASILDVLVEWVKEGEITTIYNDKGKFPAVKLKAEDNVVRFIDKTIHPFPIAGIDTKSRDRVRMSVLDFIPGDTFAITDKVEQLRKVTVGKNMGSCDGVIFPMVDYNRQVDISWICGMATGPIDSWFISQAFQQTMFRMNEKGAHAKSAVAMTLRCKCAATADHWIRIDKPFILWIERPGVDMPLFAGVFAEDVWKKPEEL